MTVEANKALRLVRLARDGLLRARDLEAAGIPRSYLKRLAIRGSLERIDRGLYRVPAAKVTQHHSLAEVAVRTPRAVVCLFSALQLHELTTESPREIWVMINTRARTPKIDYPPIKVVRASGKALTHGVEERTIEKQTVRVTTPAKTVADCFRYRRHVGLDVALDALREYLRKHKKGVDELVRAAKADQIYSVMRPYLEALV